MTEQDKLISEVEDGLAAISGLFASDVITLGKNKLDETIRVYGTATAASVTDNVAQNYIYALAGVCYPDKPVTPRVHAAAKLMALAITLVTSEASNDLLADAVKEIGVMGQRLVAERQQAREAATARQQTQGETFTGYSQNDEPDEDNTFNREPVSPTEATRMMRDAPVQLKQAR